WGACDPRDPNACIQVGGNSRDCTGVLTCDFAVNRQHRLEAEHAVLTIGQQSLGCYLCAQPNCVGGIPTCEPVSQQCILVGGGVTPPPGGQDAGSPGLTTTPPPVQEAGSMGPFPPIGDL
ncbi:MAG: hypothetical protein JOZ69_13080, partial [Myxococcales bacterium]|nr:hypothetical protein [Myxococcales bacterium]